MVITVIDSFPEDFIQALQALPVTVQYLPEAQRGDILPQLAETEILVLNSKIKVDREAIDAAPKLRLVLRAGVGLDHVDVDYLREKDIEAYNTAGANADAVAEQTVGMLLSLRHHLRRADQQVRQFSWQREANRGHEIKGHTVGLIGYGHTGKAVARRLSGFQPRVLAYDKYLSGYGEIFAAQASPEQIFQHADVLSLHVPLTAETHEMVDLAYLEQFQKPIYLLNLARGPIVKLPDLLDALEQGLVLGAALDVLPNEKFDTLTSEEKDLYQRLFDRDDVLLSPHIGGWTVESRQNINQALLKQCSLFIGH
mgnify:CR=1 FL=1